MSTSCAILCTITSQIQLNLMLNKACYHYPDQIYRRYMHSVSHPLSFVQERGALRSCSSRPAINCSWSGCIIVFPGASNNCGIGRIVEAVPCSSCYATGAISTTSCFLSLHMDKEAAWGATRANLRQINTI